MRVRACVRACACMWAMTSILPRTLLINTLLLVVTVMMFYLVEASLRMCLAAVGSDTTMNDLGPKHSLYMSPKSYG